LNDFDDRTGYSSDFCDCSEWRKIRKQRFFGSFQARLWERSKRQDAASATVEAASSRFLPDRHQATGTAAHVAANVQPAVAHQCPPIPRDANL
jgi:hypothetical protein